MPNFLQQDTLVGQNFTLEIKGDVITYLSSVSGLDIEMEHSELVQSTGKGKKVLRKMLGSHVKAPDLTLTRAAPPTIEGDPMWEWFNKIHKGGMPLSDRGASRKDGSIVIYDSSLIEVARFNFFSAWPTKISTSELSVDSNDPIKETITLVCERLVREK